MLLRAAVIYVLAVAILLLGGAVAVQRIQIATVKSERVSAENAATEMRKQLDTLHSGKSDLERLVRLASHGVGEEKQKREEAEQLARQLRDQLDTLTASNQFSDTARKAVEAKIATPDADKVAHEAALAETRKELEHARQAADAAEKEVDELRQQVLGLSARIAALTPAVKVGGAAVAIEPPVANSTGKKAAAATPETSAAASPGPVLVPSANDPQQTAAKSAESEKTKVAAPEVTGALPDKASDREKPVAKPEIRRAPAKQAVHVKREPLRRARRATPGTSEGAAASSGSAETFAPF